MSPFARAVALSVGLSGAAAGACLYDVAPLSQPGDAGGSGICRSIAVPDSSCTQSASNCANQILATPSDAGSDDAIALDVALDDQYVYWVAQAGPGCAPGGCQPAPGVVKRVPKGGGPADFLAQNEDGPSLVAVDDAWVYWVTTKEVRRLPKGSVCNPDCTAPEVIASGVFTSVVPVEGGVWVTGDPPSQLALATPDDGGGWTLGTSYPSLPYSLLGSNGRDIVWKGLLPNNDVQLDLLTGGARTNLAVLADAGKDTVFVLDCTSTWVHIETSTDLVRVDLEGGQPADRGPAGAFYVPKMAVDDRFVYYAHPGVGSVNRTPKNAAQDGSLDTIGDQTARVGALAVDDTAVYYTDYASGYVRKIIK